MPGDLETTPISRLSANYYLTYANLPTSGVRTGELGYATDRKVLYRWSGTAWQALTIYSDSGTLGNRPNAADLPNGSLYYETDTGITDQVVAGTWVAISGGISSKVKNETRALNAGSGNVSYTGYGFKPRALVIVGMINTRTDFTIGYADVNGAGTGGYYNSNLNGYFPNFNLIQVASGALLGSQANLVSLDADGFTLAWTESFAYAGTLTLLVLALR